MSVTVPAKKPALFRAMETDFGTTVASSLWRRVVEHITWYEKNVPVGLITFFHGSQRYADGTPGTLIDQPLAGEWDYVDGSLVNNAHSPLNGVTLPNISNLFLKGSLTAGINGGSNTINLLHDHQTGVVNDRTDYSAIRSALGGNDISHGGPHSHPITGSLYDPTRQKIPPYKSIQALIRIGGMRTLIPGFPIDGTFLGIDDDFTNFGKLVSRELAEAIADAISYLQKSIPSGMVLPILTNVPGVPAPDANIWQLADGSKITNENSPLRSFGGVDHFTPDMTERFLRFVTNLGVCGVPWGSNQFDGFRHNHGGWTGDTDPPQLANTVLQWFNTIYHKHPITEGLIGPFNMEPEHYTVKWYMKIQ